MERAFEKKWEKLMDSPDGEDILKALTEMYVFRTSHCPGDPYETAFREGQRDVANFLINLVLKKDN